MLRRHSFLIQMAFVLYAIKCSASVKHISKGLNAQLYEFEICL